MWTNIKIYKLLIKDLEPLIKEKDYKKIISYLHSKKIKELEETIYIDCKKEIKSPKVLLNKNIFHIISDNEIKYRLDLWDKYKDFPTLWKLQNNYLGFIFFSPILDLFFQEIGDYKINCYKGFDLIGLDKWLCTCKRCGHSMEISGINLINNKIEPCFCNKKENILNRLILENISLKLL